MRSLGIGYNSYIYITQNKNSSYILTKSKSKSMKSGYQSSEKSAKLLIIFVVISTSHPFSVDMRIPDSFEKLSTLVETCISSSGALEYIPSTYNHSK